MPLHDWSNTRLFSGVHHSWLTELLRDVKRKLPPGYHAYNSTLPFVMVGLTVGDSDVKVTRSNGLVHTLPPPPPTDGRAAGEPEPDAAGVATTLTAPDTTLVVEFEGLLVAAVEVVSPQNKHSAGLRASYGDRYLGYLRQAVNLMVLDVLPAPRGFSFPDLIARELALPDQPAAPAPVAVSYRVIPGPPREPCSYELWRRPLAVGRPLPSLPLPIGPTQSVMVDLEGTYMRAADDIYLS